MAATYIAALTYVFSGAAPQGAPDETLQIITECLDPASYLPTTSVSLFYVIFNSLGVMPALYAAVLLPGASDQAPVPPQTIACSFAFGYGALGPYLALRRPRPDPVALSDLGFWGKLTENKVFAVAMVLSALSLGSKLFLIEDWASAIATYSQLFDAFGLVNVSSFDLLVLQLFFFEPAREDMRRRGWWASPGENPTAEQIVRLSAFCAVPVLGPAAYVLARPSLED